MSRAADLETELRFSYGHSKPLIPAVLDGQLDCYEWGNRDRTDTRLPKTAWCRQESLQTGKWAKLSPKFVRIPALYGMENGHWFKFEQSLEGILVHDEGGQPHVYMVTEEASDWYRYKLGNKRMPRLVDQLF